MARKSAIITILTAGYAKDYAINRVKVRIRNGKRHDIFIFIFTDKKRIY